MSRESELAALVRRFPRWEAWRGVSGLFCARLRGTSDRSVSGEDPTDLADSIERARRLEASGELSAGHLDRISRDHPDWSVRHVTAGFGWTAHRGAERAWASTLADLERQLGAAEDTGEPEGSRPG
jgi:hypothetical protein